MNIIIIQLGGKINWGPFDVPTMDRILFYIFFFVEAVTEFTCVIVQEIVN